MFSQLWWFAFFGVVNVIVWSNIFLFAGLFYLDYRFNGGKKEFGKFRIYFAESVRGFAEPVRGLKK
jgi:hypothetical protein